MSNNAIVAERSRFGPARNRAMLPMAKPASVSPTNVCPAPRCHPSQPMVTVVLASQRTPKVRGEPKQAQQSESLQHGANPDERRRNVCVRAGDVCRRCAGVRCCRACCGAHHNRSNRQNRSDNTACRGELIQTVGSPWFRSVAERSRSRELLNCHANTVKPCGLLTSTRGLMTGLIFCASTWPRYPQRGAVGDENSVCGRASVARFCANRSKERDDGRCLRQIRLAELYTPAGSAAGTAVVACCRARVRRGDATAVTRSDTVMPPSRYRVIACRIAADSLADIAVLRSDQSTVSIARLRVERHQPGV
jgi:hypothetical protein